MFDFGSLPAFRIGTKAAANSRAASDSVGIREQGRDIAKQDSRLRKVGIARIFV